MTDLAEIPVTAADGSQADLTAHKDKVLLVVNVEEAAAAAKKAAAAQRGQ